MSSKTAEQRKTQRKLITRDIALAAVILTAVGFLLWLAGNVTGSGLGWREMGTFAVAYAVAVIYRRVTVKIRSKKMNTLDAGMKA